MRFNLKQFINSSFLAVAILTAFSGCKDDDEAQKWVDLRYKVEQDSYMIDALGTEQVTIYVKSTDPWEVFGENRSDWYSISPSTGDPGETYTVNITCHENKELDDRSDIINIKSDYWTGKKFTLTQKGTAYLNVEGVDLINQEGDPETFNVLTNQKWTAKVTEGDIWLSIKSGTSGELDGQITVTATPNTGEQRTGVVTIYDRHGVVAQEVQCTQDGVLLNPETPENGSWFRLYEEAQQLTIHVESNAGWTVSKENEEDDTWYHFAETSFNGTADLVINVDEHIGSSVRTATILLSTVAEEGATPLVKKVRFKQANPKIPQTTELNKVISGDYYGPSGLMPGRYNFYFEPFGATNVNLFWIWNGSTPYAELRYHIINKKTQLSTTPWCSDVFNESAACTRPVNTDQPNVLTLDIQERETSTGKWIYTEWMLNGETIVWAISDGLNEVNGTGDTWKVPFDQISGGATFLIRTSGGSATLTKWEFIAPLAWGD